ncbi:MAG TPA: OmpA family protein [Bauldia sp.]|nr:OmpA family protein [Bauldia sp.]
MRLPVAAAFAILLTAASSLAEEDAGTVRDLEFTVSDLEFKVLDLVLDEAGVGGTIRSLDIIETETEIRIEVPADILFDFDKSSIRDDAAAALDEVANILRAHPGLAVRIEGHTDSRGSETYNQRLSEDRARSVKEWLTRGKGLDGAAFAVKGLGEASPAMPNERPDGTDDPDARQKNRRVEIVIEKASASR